VRSKEVFAYSRITGYFCSVVNVRVSGSSKRPDPPGWGRRAGACHDARGDGARHDQTDQCGTFALVRWKGLRQGLSIHGQCPLIAHRETFEFVAFFGQRPAFFGQRIFWKATSRSCRQSIYRIIGRDIANWTRSRLVKKLLGLGVVACALITSHAR
jgi:hypothetical protein